MIYRPGEVALLLFPFTGGQGAKRRPALVLLDSGDDDIIVACITSSGVRDPFDVELASWRQAGLLAPSVARVHKLLTIEKGLVARQLGALALADWAQVRAAVRRLWGV